MGNLRILDGPNYRGNPDPLHVSISGNPSGGATPLPVQFTSTVTGGTPIPSYTYSWTFGDGSTDTSANPTHSYTTAGIFVATLTVHDGLSRTAQSTFSVTTYTPLKITASEDVSSGVATLTVHFSCSASGGSPTYSYLWSFGDGTTSSEANPSHQYTQPDAYSVSLTVTDSQSRQQTYRTTISVSKETGNGGTTTGGGNGGTAGGSSNAGMDNIMIYLIVGIIIIAALAIVSIVVVLRRKKVSPPVQPPYQPQTPPTQ